MFQTALGRHEGAAANSFSFRVACGWLRDLASEPRPGSPWPDVTWDDQLLADQLRFLDAQREHAVTYNVAWGLFISRSWPVPFENVIDDHRAGYLRAFVEAAHRRGLKVLAGVGIYSWGFDEVIARVPGASAGHEHAMCSFSDVAWDWQRRVLDFLMDPRWGLDGVSMQSADQGRCLCPRCSALSPAEYHARILVRSADHLRASRPDCVVGQAGWGLRLDEPDELSHLVDISKAVDYMVEVREVSRERGRRRLAADLGCAFGSVGGVFVEPPQHWNRLRWLVPCGLSSAGALVDLHRDGGRACEFFYRPFANPGEEVSWRTGAAVLASAAVRPQTALERAVANVYDVTGSELSALTDWYARAEKAYFSRTTFEVGQGPISLEPLIWEEDATAAGPPVYLRDRMSPRQRSDYAEELMRLKAELATIRIPNDVAADRTAACIDGALRDLRSLG